MGRKRQQHEDGDPETLGTAEGKEMESAKAKKKEKGQRKAENGGGLEMDGEVGRLPDAEPQSIGTFQENGHGSKKKRKKRDKSLKENCLHGVEEAGEGCSDREGEAVRVSENGGSGKVRPGKKKQKKLAKEGATVEFESNGVVKAEETDKWNEGDYADVRRMKKKKGKEENGTVESALVGKPDENLTKLEKKCNGVVKAQNNYESGTKGNGVEKTGVEKGDERDFKEKVVTVSGNDVELPKYTAFKSFVDSGLPREVLHCCMTFSKPSPIQSRAWPFLLDGRDFIGIAATGSGKTLAFGVPALMHILQKVNSKQGRKRLPLCLVLSPTRELAQQIADVLSDSGRPCGLKTVCLYGGTSKEKQISSLKSGIDIVVGTPGRLKDLIEMGICCLKEVSFVRPLVFVHCFGENIGHTVTMVPIFCMVLDEADRMLDMGFEPEVRAIVSQTNSKRQTVMFSATWPLAVHQLAQEFMDPNPVKVVVGSEDLAANHDVMQIVEVLDDRSRDARLVALLEKYHQSQRVLVFVLYKKEASRVEIMLQKRGWKVVSVHGDKAQAQRTNALSLFKEGKCPLMIATDVASRGLDIPNVEVVINYSFPLTTEDYVHRIGRTGRAGKKGVAHTFFTQENKGLAGELVNVLREAGQVIPQALLKFGTHVKKKESKLYGAHFKEVAADAPKATKITFNDSDEDS
ncbi:DEAD-box ATP-dependent RNA helicase 5 isoform X2 [Nymphaea colorata]|uniref:DEAD-box ATP-dependent RNA helicase 5 isoform X2 n=1 Tax=Nymphaea colorata TaxID=210225 RepID=UPI00214F3E2B|nr:DEAD-box ATP-dependent RNA helicase 5 isoform X2 [Nymphaea colorata]